MLTASHCSFTWAILIHVPSCLGNLNAIHVPKRVFLQAILQPSPMKTDTDT